MEQTTMASELYSVFGWFVLTIIAGLVFGLTAGKIGESRKRRYRDCFLAGFLGGPIGLLIVATSPMPTSAAYMQPQLRSQPPVAEAARVNAVAHAASVAVGTPTGFNAQPPAAEEPMQGHRTSVNLNLRAIQVFHQLSAFACDDGFVTVTNEQGEQLRLDLR